MWCGFTTAFVSGQAGVLVHLFKHDDSLTQLSTETFFQQEPLLAVGVTGLSVALGILFVKWLGKGALRYS